VALVVGLRTYEKFWRIKHMDNPPRNDHTVDILDAVGDAFLTLDKESLVMYANKEMGRLLNCNVSELIGVPMVGLIPDSTSWMFHWYFENAMNGKPGTLEGFRFANKVFEVFFYPMQDGVTISLRDITTRRQIDELSKLALFVLDRIYEKVFLVRSDGRLFHVNQETCSTLGYTLNELIHMKIFDIDPTIKVDDWNDRFNSIKKWGHIAFESMLRTKGGGLIPVEVRANYLLLYGVEYYCVSARDITERKKAEEELRQAHSDLEKRVEERTKELMHEKMEAELYLDLMGHDISNMHQIAMSQLELAQEIMAEKGRLEGDEKELIDTPLKTLKRSARLIDNVRKLQKLRTGEYKTKLIDLGALLANVVEEYSNMPEIDVTINYSTANGCYVRANSLLKDVFSNLIGNAIKYSKGSVTINIGVSKAADNGSSFYQVAVEDNGPGIPDAKKKEVFHRLKRGMTQARGTGLGLYIVKTLVDNFHGRVKVEDRISGDYTKGSRFLVYLPVVEDEHGE
jgi:PAS domain S-box-containing protein